jgi:hypothetical protein
MEEKIISDLGAGLARGAKGQIYFSFATVFSRRAQPVKLTEEVWQSPVTKFPGRPHFID